MYKCSLERMSDKIKTFSQFGDAGHGGITRYSLSPEAKMARAELELKSKQTTWLTSMQLFQELIRTLRESSQDLTVTPLKTVVTTTVSWVL